jgi:hypothetical protein
LATPSPSGTPLSPVDSAELDGINNGASKASRVFAEVAASSELLLEIMGIGGANGGAYAGLLQVTPSAVPLPAAAWLLLSDLLGMSLMARRRLAA